MIIKIFSIFDSKAQAYLPPFLLPNEEMAKRVFRDCANDTNHQFGKHPADYTLFHLGAFSDENGRIETLETPYPICKAIELVKEPAQTLELFQKEA